MRYGSNLVAGLADTLSGAPIRAAVSIGWRRSIARWQLVGEKRRPEMSVSPPKARIVRDFNDPIVSSKIWMHLLPRGEIDTVFLTWTWQRVWWEVFGRGQLLLIVIERNEEPVAIAPLFCDGGMVFFV